MSTWIVENMEKMVARYIELGEQLSSREVLSNPALISQMAKERYELEPMLQAYDKYKDLTIQSEDARKLLIEEQDE